MFSRNTSRTLLFSLFTFLVAQSQARTTLVSSGDSTTITIDCRVMNDPSKPLQLTLQESSILLDPASDSNSERKVLKVTAKNLEGERTFSGFYETFNKGNIDYERIQYEPLEMLGVSEINLARISFYFAQESTASYEYEFVFAASYKDNVGDPTAPSFAGLYGSYFRENVLCPLELE